LIQAVSDFEKVIDTVLVIFYFEGVEGEGDLENSMKNQFWRKSERKYGGFCISTKFDRYLIADGNRDFPNALF
jgi:hypothetical protein